MGEGEHNQRQGDPQMAAIIESAKGQEKLNDERHADIKSWMQRMDNTIDQLSKAVAPLQTLTNHVEDFLNMVETINKNIFQGNQKNSEEIGTLGKRVTAIEIELAKQSGSSTTKNAFSKAAWDKLIGPGLLMVLAALVGGYVANLIRPQAPVQFTSAPVINTAPQRKEVQ